MTTLYYIHDPMCSWCWGFKPVWDKLNKQLPDNINIQYLLGGLAKDTDKTMPVSLQKTLQETWHRIQKEIPGTKFNFDFWTKNTPKRSTYPACRAVIAARKQLPSAEYKMIDKIQSAYYLQALNPSDPDVLTLLAEEINLDTTLFNKDISSDGTQSKLNTEIQLSRELGAQGFPSLVLSHKNQHYFIGLDYNNTDYMNRSISEIIEV